MRLNILDIETTADKEKALALLPPFDPAEVKTGNMKDEAKISAKIAEAKANHESDWLDQSALYAERGKVLVAAWLGKNGEKYSLFEGDEIDILEGVWLRVAEALIENEKIAGHCHLSFDLPFLIRRSWILGVDVPSTVRTFVRGRFYWNENFIDTRDLWQLGQRDYKSSLDYVAKAFGQPGKTGNGKNFADLYASDREAALEYLRNDLRETLGIARQMGL